MNKFGVIIVAAGRGERLKTPVPKCLIPIDGLPLFMLSLNTFAGISMVSEIVLVVPSNYMFEVETLISQFKYNKIINVVAGGEQRQDSVRSGVQSLSATVNKVLIHDAARPFVSDGLINNLIKVLETHQAATVALPVGDTIHKSHNGFSAAGPDRSVLWAAQTPQGFDRELLERSYRLLNGNNSIKTDEVSLVRELCRVESCLVTGESSNIKITRPDDLEFYMPLLQNRIPAIAERFS